MHFKATAVVTTLVMIGTSAQSTTPLCAQTCQKDQKVVDAFLKTGCTSATDFACVCSTKGTALVSALSACVKANCDPKSQLRMLSPCLLSFEEKDTD
jgi:hypothetical protein